jgi:putative oxidoreductase
MDIVGSDLGLLLLRVVVGGLLAAHGAQKLFGWFGGYGLDGVAGWFGSIGFRPARPMAIIAGLGELVGGTLLVLGLLTPVAAAVVLGTLLVAASTHLPKLWATDGGLETPLLYAVAAGALGYTGAGGLSLDAALDLSLAGAGWGTAALVAGVFGAVLVAGSAKANLRREAQSSDPYPADGTTETAGQPAV